MREKSFALLACVFFLLSIVGMGYAQWDDTVIISSTMTFGSPYLAFVDPLECQDYHKDPSSGLCLPGEYKGKDVGKFECKYVDQVDTQEAYKTLSVSLSNAYPGYIVKCKFNIVIVGAPSAKIDGVTISDPSGTLVWDEIEGALVDSSNDPVIYVDFDPELLGSELTSTEKEFEMSIEIAQNAKEYFQYIFEVQISCEGA